MQTHKHEKYYLTEGSHLESDAGRRGVFKFFLHVAFFCNTSRTGQPW